MPEGSDLGEEEAPSLPGLSDGAGPEGQFGPREFFVSGSDGALDPEYRVGTLILPSDVTISAIASSHWPF